VDFDTFFANSWSEMLARAVVLSGSRHDAEDAVQEAYAAALTSWDRISTYDNPGAWVYKIVRQRLWKAARHWRRVSASGQDDLGTFQATDGDPERFAEATLALRALAQLPDRQRVVMVMHCLHDMDQKQIATELGVSRGTVAATVHKARRKLEKTLGMKDTELAGVERPGSGITRPDPGPVSDPLAAVLNDLESVLRQRIGRQAGGERLAAVRARLGD
jgi:RNA polymerase sigma factor (sigma-70 family)